jgi:hypothetical protein
MGFSLFPRSVKFFKLFGEQNRKLNMAACHLSALFEDGADARSCASRSTSSRPKQRHPRNIARNSR